MDLSAILKAVLAPEYTCGTDPLASLRVGDRLTGQVLRLEADGRALIDLGGVRALAQTTIDVRPGQMLHLKVAGTGVPLQLRLDAPSAPVPPAPLPKMTLTGLLQPDDQQRLLRIIDRFLAAPTSLGDVAQDGKTPIGRPETATLQNAHSNADRIAGAIPLSSSAQSSEAVRQAMVVLRGLFAPLPVGAAASADHLAAVVRSTIEDRGILFEIKLAQVLDQTATASRHGDHPASKSALAENPNAAADSSASRVRQIMLRDLKPQLLVLKGLFSDSQPAPSSIPSTKINDSAFLRQTVTHLLAHLEQQQQRAVQRADVRDPSHVVAHVLSTAEGRQPVRLKVYYPKNGREGDAREGHRIALLLDMDRLGPVRVDLSMSGRDLRILFHVRDADTRQCLDCHADEIALALKGQFDHIQIATQVSGQAIARFDSEDLEGPAVAGVDIRA